MLEEAVDLIEELTPGVPPPLSTQAAVMNAYELQRKQVGHVLIQMIAENLAYFDEFKVFSELKSFESKVIDDDTLALLQACLMLVGYDKKTVEIWEKIQKVLKNPRKIKEQMQLVEIGEEINEKAKGRWDAVSKCLRNVDLRELERRGSVPIKILIRWLDGTRCAHNIQLALATEDKVEDNPMANQIFDAIDLDGDGMIQASELVRYMLSEYPSRVAHRLLRILDTDGDMKVSRTEWQRGWAAGLISELLVSHTQTRRQSRESVADSSDAPPEIGSGRMAGRRTGGVTALTAATAARLHETDAVSDKGKGKGKGRGKKKLEPLPARDETVNKRATDQGSSSRGGR